VGGIARGTDVIQYLMAGASLVAMGTAALRDPRAPERVISEMREWCVAHDVSRISEIVGSLEWPS
jgi:dihydroorotate dehydrogenase (NAD+) catalytic subunit